MEEQRLAADWSASPLRRFVHFEARPCRACGGVSQLPPCRRCSGSRFESVEEVERGYPASAEACAFFAREAGRLTVAEDAARELAGAATHRLRWKTAAEEPFGTAPARWRSALLDEASVAVESVTEDALTLTALGVPCPCHQAEWQGRPAHVTRHLGTDGAQAEVTVETCTCCGATWLEYFFEDHYDNGSRCRGLVSAALTREVTAQSAAALLGELPWYWLGGTYYFGKTSRSSGAVRRL